MACFYRVVSFGKPMGPWRSQRRHAQQDAVALDLGSYDDYGVFWATVPGDIEWIHETALKSNASEAA